jgi:hypothetical protein
MEGEIINRVSASALITFDLEAHYTPGERVLYDLKDNLYQHLILREKEFREFIKNHDWVSYSNKLVAITCSADAIIPTWAYMLVSAALQPYAAKVVHGSLADLETILYHETLAKVDWQRFQGAKVVIKGCSKLAVPVSAYVETTNRLQGIATSIMFGEPCSTVPIHKSKK